MPAAITIEVYHAMTTRAWEQGPYAALVVDSEGIVRVMNAQAELLFGYSRDDVLGKPVEQLIPDTEGLHARHVEHRAKYMARPTIKVMGARKGLNLVGLHKSGAAFPVHITLKPFPVPSYGIVVNVVIRTPEDDDG